MTDQAYTRGDTSAFEDDFEWVNAWAASPPQCAGAPPAAPPESAPQVSAAVAAEKRSVERAQFDIPLAPVADDPPLAAAEPLAEPPDSSSEPPAPTSDAAVAHTLAIGPSAPAAPQHSMMDADLPSSPAPSVSVDPHEPPDPAMAVEAEESESAAAALPEPEPAPAIPLFETARRLGRKRWTNLFRLVTRNAEAEAAASEPPAATLAPALADPDSDAQPIVVEADNEFPIAPDQLERDIAEIESVRDRLLAESALPRRRAIRFAPVRTSDYVPILVGGVLAFTSLVVFGAAASFVSLR